MKRQHILIGALSAVALLLIAVSVTHITSSNNEEKALDTYVPNSYVDVIEKYGDSGPEYELAMGRYVKSVMCDQITEVIGKFENVEMFFRGDFDARYRGLGDQVKSGNELLIGSQSVKSNLGDIINYGGVKGTNGEAALNQLINLSAQLDSHMMSTRITKQEWTTLQLLLEGWHKSYEFDNPVSQCISNSIVNDGWTAG